MTKTSKYKIGHRFGQLTLQSVDRVNHPNNGKATLICDCGNEASFFMSVLASGHNTDCGCSEYTTIYFIQVRNYVKIGRCKPGGVKNRFSLLQVNCPYPAILLGTTPGDYNTEQKLHKAFNYLHHRGEWFELAPEILAVIADRTNVTVTDNTVVANLEDLL